MLGRNHRKYPLLLPLAPQAEARGARGEIGHSLPRRQLAANQSRHMLRELCRAAPSTSVPNPGAGQHGRHRRRTDPAARLQRVLEAGQARGPGGLAQGAPVACSVRASVVQQLRFLAANVGAGCSCRPQVAATRQDLVVQQLRFPAANLGPGCSCRPQVAAARQDLDLPWVVRKAVLKYNGQGQAAELISHVGPTLRIVTVNSKASWCRESADSRVLAQVRLPDPCPVCRLRVPLLRTARVQRNALGEAVKVEAHWEGNVHKATMTGGRHGVHHCWRYMEGDMMAVRSAIVSDKGRESVMHWYMERIAEPERLLFHADGAAQAVVQAPWPRGVSPIGLCWPGQGAPGAAAAARPVSREPRQLGEACAHMQAPAGWTRWPPPRSASGLPQPRTTPCCWWAHRRGAAAQEVLAAPCRRPAGACRACCSRRASSTRPQTTCPSTRTGTQPLASTR